MSLGVRGSRFLLSLWALELQTAQVLAMAHVEGDWPDRIVEGVEMAARDLVDKLQRG